MAAEISAGDLAGRLRDERDGSLLLLDVREPDERELAHIEPSVFIPMGELPNRLAEVPKDRSVVVYCHHGTRSAIVVAYLVHEGYADVVNLRGGIDAWSVEVDPKVPRYT